MSSKIDFDTILANEETKEEFCKWFWQGKNNKTTNSNSLVEALNTSLHRSTDYVRKEKFRPCIYGIALKHNYDGDWQFVKIGFTHVDTSEESSRMTTIHDKIQKEYGKDVGSTLFVLAINPVDTTTYTDTEKRFRQKLGIPVQKKLAQKLSFPVATEWVMTTSAFNKMIVADIKTEREKRNAHTGLLKNQFQASIPVPPSLTLRNGETVQICHKNGKICLEESGTSESPQASRKKTKASKETKKEELTLKESGTPEQPGISGQEEHASKRISKGEKPKK